MGIVQIFNISANFSRISDQELKVDRIIQQISVDISRSGAAASSSSEICKYIDVILIRGDNPTVYKGPKVDNQ